MKKLLKLTLTLLILNTLYLIPLNAQVGINNDNSEPDASAMLDVKSSSKGVLIPRMSSSDRQQILDPAVGLMVYDSTAQAFYYFNGMGWLELLSGSVIFLEDSDQDTKIQVEESTDEDIIRFDLAGTEFMRLDSGRVEVLNTGGSVYIGENAGTNDNFTSNDNQNIGIGLNVLNSLTTGNKNIAIGNDALSNLTDGGLNIAIGDNALMKNNGSDNIGIGDEALRENIDGGDNVAIGDQALRDNIDGDDNIAIGDFPLSENISGTDNIALGDGALSQNLTGDNNIGVGDGAGNGNEKGNRNIFLGRGAGTNMDSLNNAIAIGAGTMVEQDSSIILGNGLKVGISTSTPQEALHVVGNTLINGDLEVTGSFPQRDRIISTSNAWRTIANNANISITDGFSERFTLSSNTINLSVGVNTGFGNTQRIQFNDGSNNNQISNVFPNLTTIPSPTNADYQMQFKVRNDIPLIIKGNGSVEINEAYTLPTTDGTVDQILATDGNGNVDWIDASTAIVQDTDKDTRIQVEESADEDVIRFDLEGTEYFRMEKGRLETPNSGLSVLIGQDAGVNDDLTDKENVAIGYKALEQNVSAGSNTSVGAFSLNALTGGGANTAIGIGALQNSRNGNENVAIGAGALSNSVGNLATGDGSDNVAIGYNAGLNNRGKGNVFLGYATDISGLVSNRLVIDNSNTTSPLIYGEFNNNFLRVNGNFNTTGNTTINGTLGAGNTTINGTLKVGSSGSNISSIIKASISRDVGNINGNNGRTETFTVTGATVGSVVHVSPRTSLGGQIVIAQAWVSATNTVSVRFRNTDGGGQNPPNTTYDIVVIQ